MCGWPKNVVNLEFKMGYIEFAEKNTMPTPSIQLLLTRRVNNSWRAGLTIAEWPMPAITNSI